MPTVQLVQRMLTTVSQISFKRQKQPGMLNFNETQRLFNAHEALSNSKIFVDDNSGNTPGDIISKCRRMKNTVGLDLVIIDYLQLITLDTKSKAENRQQEVSTMSRQMKLYAKELGVPFWCFRSCRAVPSSAGKSRNFPTFANRAQSNRTPIW